MISVDRREVNINNWDIQRRKEDASSPNAFLLDFAWRIDLDKQLTFCLVEFACVKWVG